MKRSIVFAVIALLLFSYPTVYASEFIKAYLFPVQLEVNGQIKPLPQEYQILNVNGHAYVPVRYVSESMGLGVRYDEKNQVISIASDPKEADELTRFIWKVQYKLDYRLSQSDLKNLLERNPQVVKKNNEGGEHWRFDVKVASDYRYSSIEQGDEAGLLEGKVGAQLFLTWDSNGKLAKINLWYTKLNGEKQPQIHVFNAFPDGTTTDSIYE